MQAEKDSCRYINRRASPDVVPHHCTQMMQMAGRCMLGVSRVVVDLTAAAATAARCTPHLVDVSTTGATGSAGAQPQQLSATFSQQVLGFASSAIPQQPATQTQQPSQQQPVLGADLMSQALQQKAERQLLELLEKQQQSQQGEEEDEDEQDVSCLRSCLRNNMTGQCCVMLGLIP
jgi:hypothetical protein